MRTYLLVASLAVSAVAQEPQELKPVDAFARFQTKNGGQWVAQWNRATGTPSTIYGTGLRLADWRENTLEEARRHALATLEQNRDLLGLGTDDFRESIGARMGRTWSFTFDQFHGGLPVIGGRADVRINMAGVVAMLGSEAVPIAADFVVVPAIAENVAVAVAWTALGTTPHAVPQPGNARKPRLVVWADLARTDAIAQPHLAWEVPISNVDANGKGPVGRYYVDAANGAVLEYRTDKHECGIAGCGTPHGNAAAPATPPVSTTVTLMCWTRTGIDAGSPLVNVPLPGIVLNIPGATPSQVTTDAQGRFTIDITGPTNVSVGNLDGRHHAPMIGASAPTATVTVNPGVATTLQLSTPSAQVPEAAHPATAYYLDWVNEWVRSIVGNSAQMNTADAVVPTVNIASTCNAYYTNNTVNFYAAGAGCANTGYSTVVAHEWGHGLDDRYGGISNNNGDGLSEGWGDIVGMYLVDSPLLGSGFQTPGVALRHGMNTTMYGTQTEVHAAGEVWMGFAWRYRENLRAAYGTTAAIAISNTTVMGSIVANASNQAGAVTQVFVADDDDGNLLNGVPHYAELSAAATAKGLPFPQALIDVDHTPMTSAWPRGSSRVVTMTASLLGSGSITATRVHYDAGSGAMQRNMKPTMMPDEYNAVLPATSGTSLGYHIEVEHSSGSVMRLPATGEYTYPVQGGAFTSFWLDNFDTGGAGWTFGTTSGVGEWQVGAPAGKTGTSLSVFWTDPANPVSAPNCFAVDLGLGTSNGRYNATTNQWLRSPIVNCTGRYGVRVRFQRWLTVERGLNDQAILLCNGVQVWANPLDTNLLDNAWQQVEYNLPMADNNPSVQLEWRLVTDASLHLGGWQIDDVELGFTPMTTPDALLCMVPEQAVSGEASIVTVVTPGGFRPFLVGIGDLPGPTSIPGIPTMMVGGMFDVFSAATDANGNWTVPFTAPQVFGSSGVLFYMQALTFDPTFTQLVVSNPFATMFTETL